MAETDDHTLWLGTANYGICKVINENELQTGYEKKYGMAENSVRSLLASSDGNLYVGYMEHDAADYLDKELGTVAHTDKVIGNADKVQHDDGAEGDKGTRKQRKNLSIPI